MASGATRSAADETIVGRRITLDTSSFTVVGVAAAVPRQPPLYQELWTPLEIDPDSREFAAVLRVVGRLEPGIGREEAQAEMAVVQERLLAAAGAAAAALACCFARSRTSSTALGERL